MGRHIRAGLSVFTEIEHRGVDDVFMLVCGGLKDLPEAMEPRRRTRTLVRGLLAGLPRKNCWTSAEHAGLCAAPHRKEYADSCC
ncbi:hypothetical protein GCM10023195_86600 [Actinoallomurus liliacearum]|uniref:Uncharacterized protein n=1 Tax=Actinoallomurus liliacearum TaxID=1080073 RepID=A0ABP8U197_9ACTN